MTKDNTEGNAVAERVRAANISVGGSSSVKAMLANALKERKPLADDGKLHDTIQAAENAASAFVFIPPGTFNESFTIDTAGLTLLGSGSASVINSSDGNKTISVSANDVSIESIKIVQESDINCIDLGGIQNASAEGIRVVNNGNGGGINCGDNSMISNCVIESVANNAIYTEDTGSAGCVIRSNHIKETRTTSGNGILVRRDDSIISNNTVTNASSRGINLSGGTYGNDCIVIGNRVHNSTDEGILIGKNDVTVANNRISDSGGSDINDNGTGTTLDSNLTGSAN